MVLISAVRDYINRMLQDISGMKVLILDPSTVIDFPTLFLSWVLEFVIFDHHLGNHHHPAHRNYDSDYKIRLFLNLCSNC